MPLLLFLSAMLAGLTGLVAGERAVEPRQVEQAIAAAASVAEAAPLAVREAESARLEGAPAAPASSRAVHSRQVEPALGGRAPVDERRLE